MYVYNGTGSIVVLVVYGVSLVEAAAAVVVRAIEDRVLALRVIPGGDVPGAVIAVAVAGRDVDAVRLMAADRDGRGGGVGKPVRAAGRAAAGCVDQVVAVA